MNADKYTFTLDLICLTFSFVLFAASLKVLFYKRYIAIKKNVFEQYVNKNNFYIILCLTVSYCITYALDAIFSKDIPENLCWLKNLSDWSCIIIDKWLWLFLTIETFCTVKIDSRKELLPTANVAPRQKSPMTKEKYTFGKSASLPLHGHRYPRGFSKSEWLRLHKYGGGNHAKQSIRTKSSRRASSPKAGYLPPGGLSKHTELLLKKYGKTKHAKRSIRAICKSSRMTSSLKTKLLDDTYPTDSQHMQYAEKEVPPVLSFLAMRQAFARGNRCFTYLKLSIVILFANAVAFILLVLDLGGPSKGLDFFLRNRDDCPLGGYVKIMPSPFLYIYLLNIMIALPFIVGLQTQLLWLFVRANKSTVYLKLCVIWACIICWIPRYSVHRLLELSADEYASYWSDIIDNIQTILCLQMFLLISPKLRSSINPCVLPASRNEVARKRFPPKFPRSRKRYWYNYRLWCFTNERHRHEATETSSNRREKGMKRSREDVFCAIYTTCEEEDYPEPLSSSEHYAANDGVGQPKVDLPTDEYIFDCGREATKHREIGIDKI